MLKKRRAVGRGEQTIVVIFIEYVSSQKIHLPESAVLLYVRDAASHFLMDVDVGRREGKEQEGRVARCIGD